MFLYMYIKNFLLFELLIRNNESLFELKNKKIIEYSKVKDNYLQLKTNQRKLIEYYKANTYLITFESIDNITFEIIENSINLDILKDYMKDIKENSIKPLKEIERNYLKSYKVYLKANKKQRKQRKKAKKENFINFENIFKIIKANNKLSNDIKLMIKNIDNYYIVKMNNELIESLNFKFLFYKNNHNLKYDKYKVLLTYRNIEIDNLNYKVFLYSIVLNDNIQSFIIFNKKYDFKFKFLIGSLLKLNYFEFLKENNITITNKERQLLNEIENMKYFFIDNNERKERLFNQMKENKEILENREIERKINNLRKHISIIERKAKESKGKQRQYYMKEIKQSNERLDYLLNTFIYYNESIEYCSNEIERIEINKDNFESTNTFFESISYYENYSNFEYSKKEIDLIDFLNLKNIESLK